MNQDKIKEEIIYLLRSINREGKEQLIEYLEKQGYFTGPASTKYHGNYPGGLAHHSLNVHNMFSEMVKKFNLPISQDSIVICSLLHDLCKVGAYMGNPGFYYWAGSESGHCVLSLKRIEQHIKLTDEEKAIIGHHMGFYNALEFGKLGEYPLSQMARTYDLHKTAKLFYFCDDMVSQFIDKTMLELQQTRT